MSLFHDMASIIPLPVGERGGTKSSLDRSGPMSPKAFHFLSSGESAFPPPVEANATTLSVFLRLDLFHHADKKLRIEMGFAVCRIDEPRVARPDHIEQQQIPVKGK